MPAAIDTFARDNLPPREQWPDLLFDRPELRYPARLNCAAELLDRAVEDGDGDRPCLISPAGTWSYAELQAVVNRIARVLVEDLGMIPGNRVLLRAANNPMMVACYFAVLKAGGIVVATMPLLRARELTAITDKAEIRLALCDARLMEEMAATAERSPVLDTIVAFRGDRLGDAVAAEGPDTLEARMATKPAVFEAYDSAADETCLIAFTSGTTGKPKGTMHFHRDMLAICDCFPRHVLKAERDDVFCGSPPLAFTFGLGGLVLFPMRVRAAGLLLERAGPQELLDGIARHRATVCFTAPTAYRAMLDRLEEADIASLKRCVSAGETLPKPTWEAFHAATGIGIIDGIGATELLHIFISASGGDIRPGATGKPVPGYEAKVVDADFNEVPRGTVGKLAVRGPTGCRYLADPRQTDYVRQGWNLTGDAYVEDEDGYFHYQARTDDMIVSSGYNIAGPEVETALLAHPLVKECAVVGSPDPERGALVHAFVVPREPVTDETALTKTLQDFVKQEIAPFKYPRRISFVETLPRTETGKVQRFRLKQAADA